MRTDRFHRSILMAGLFVMSLAATVAGATSPFLDYRNDSWFLPQSPSVTGGPVAGLFNPSAFALSDIAGSDFWWNDNSIRSGLDNYGLALGRSLNFAMNTTTFGNTQESYKIYDYQVGLAGGSRDNTFGLAYRWSNGETNRVDRQQALVLGATSRHDRWLNFGASGVFSLESGAAQYVFDLGLRPFQKDFLTVFADWTVNDDEVFFSDGTWGAGIALKPVDGVQVGVRAREQVGTGKVDYAAVCGVTMGFTNFTLMPQFDHDGNLGQTGFLSRSNPPIKGLPALHRVIGKSPTYYPLSLENRYLTYQKYRYFDNKRVAWLDLLPLLNGVRDDANIDIFVVNLAGFNARPSLIWEFRQKLLEIQAAGKEIIVHTDRTNARTYYLASAADSLSIDPFGQISIPGLTLSRSYLKGTLAKIGIGFQEHRFYKYKSAVETLSRESMSAADREQRGRIVDVIYETLRDGIVTNRDLQTDQFDGLVDNQGMLVAREALAAGLVDRVTRWDTLLKDLKKRGGRQIAYAPSDFNRNFWDDQWARPVKIPVVYAVGSCAMDSGINGRKTSAYLRKLAADSDVAAVVLRADSPGGDPLPSDLVAEAVRLLRAAGKPVIISQGDVAASGGYWISMDGTKVLTTPLTITGSIGVISGWIWDDGFSTKLGVTSDLVQRGEHADLYATVNLPFLGGIPRRPMNEPELDRAETIIRGMYDDFVDAVAAGRGMDRDAVHDIAQGRVWMGGDAIDNGLCDSFGTLDDAIVLARSEAGIADWQEIEIVEYPPRPFFQWPNFGPRIPGLFSMFGLGEQLNTRLEQLFAMGAGSDSTPETLALPLGAPGLSAFDVEYLQGMTRTMGNASLLVAPDMLPEAWQDLK